MNDSIQSPPVGAPLGLAQPRSEQVVALWAHMQSHYSTSLVSKLNSVEMGLIALALDRLGILEHVTFLENFTCTVGRRIYAPFEPGVARSGWDLWSQMVICVHEHQHVVQQMRLGLEFEAKYLFDHAARAEFETEALRSSLELNYWRTGRTPSATSLAQRLRHYVCGTGDIEVAEKSLALAALSVTRGAVLNDSTKVALDWLNENAPELRST